MSSKFEVGTEVALRFDSVIGTGTCVKHVVGKVHRDGKFFLRNADGTLQTQMWTPERNRPDHAKRSGQGYSRTWMEVWTSKHDDLLAEKAMQQRAMRIKSAIIERVQGHSMYDAADRISLVELAKMLAIDVEML